MKKYSEQLLIIAIAALLHFSFGSKPVNSSVSALDSKPLPSWVLEIESLVGDTLISIEYDPYFKTAKTFRAFPLKQNLMKILSSDQDPSTLQLIFQCTDGYKPFMPLEQVLSSDSFLAYADVDAPDGKAWADSLDDKFPPFYLVWSKVKKDHKSFVNPYGLERVEFKNFAEEFSAALPQDESLMEGFVLFSSTCMHCHSMNKVGGDKALEFNYPKNITEYWKKEDIWAFIQDPTSYRFNSKMPAINTIDRQDFEKIYAYLSGMKGNH